jgi:RNA polymerase sigma factor for flagellar operon FliA
MVEDPQVVARVKEGLDLVEIVAHRMRRQFGPYVEHDELVSHGREALLAAARSWDLDKGLSFRRWANLRIRGAMMDALRQQGNLPKRVYRKLRAAQAAHAIDETLDEEAAAAKPPSSAEEAEARLDARLDTVAMAMAINFLATRSGDAIDRARDDRETPEEAVGHAEVMALVQAAIAERPEQEQTLLRRHYFDDVKLEDVAKELGLSKSWASRLHTRAIEGVMKAMKRGRVGAL